MSMGASQVGIVHDLLLQELRLYTDAGRCCRPLFIVDLEKQRLHIRKEDICQLQERETTGFGWNVRPCSCRTILHPRRFCSTLLCC
jgi:hypothetical protein